jgi:sec-independent protein translocase protein TatA
LASPRPGASAGGDDVGTLVVQHPNFGQVTDMITAFLEGPDLIVVLAIVALLFGGSKLPQLARSLGEAKRELDKGMKGDTDATTTNASAVAPPLVTPPAIAAPPVVIPPTVVAQPLPVDAPPAQPPSDPTA